EEDAARAMMHNSSARKQAALNIQCQPELEVDRNRLTQLVLTLDLISELTKGAFSYCSLLELFRLFSIRPKKKRQHKKRNNGRTSNDNKKKLKQRPSKEHQTLYKQSP